MVGHYLELTTAELTDEITAFKTANPTVDY